MKRDIFAAYPLLEQAFDDAHLHTEVKNICERGISIIEDCTDFSPASKEALMVVAILSAGPAFLMADTAPLLSRYNGLVQKTAEEMKDAASGKPFTADVGRIAVAMQIAAYEHLLLQVTGNSPPPVKIAAQMKKDVTANRADLKSMNIDLDAPRLEDLYQKTCDALISALDQVSTRNRNPAAPPPHP